MLPACEKRLATAYIGLAMKGEINIARNKTPESTSATIKRTGMFVGILFAIAVAVGVCLAAPAAAFAQTDPSVHGYAPVNGLNMYYEIHGVGKPLVLLHGGGSTIYTTFGKILPSLAKNRQVIAVELQGHGHTADINRPLSFEQDADDVAAVLHHLKVENADFFGFSNGGNTAMQVALRHPGLVRKIIVGSVVYKKKGIDPQILESFKNATPENMPPVLRDAYNEVAPDPENLPTLVTKLAKRMLGFRDWRPEDIQSIKAPVLIISGNNDIASLEYTVEMAHLFPNSQLVVFPGGHGTYMGEVTAAKEGSKLPDLVVSLIEEFLDAPIPITKSEGEK